MLTLTFSPTIQFPPKPHCRSRSEDFRSHKSSFYIKTLPGNPHFYNTNNVIIFSSQTVLITFISNKRYQNCLLSQQLTFYEWF